MAAEAARAAASRDAFPGRSASQHLLPQRFERMMIAEERCLRGHHRLDNLLLQAVARLGPQVSNQLGDGIHAMPADNGRQTALDEILLAVVQDNRAVLRHNGGVLP